MTLARLREHFNDELLVQVGRKMEMTPLAERLRDPLRDVLVRISTTIDIGPDFDPTQSDREFVLHVSDYSMQVLLPHAFALAEAQGSKITFKLLPQGGAEAARELERGSVDLLVTPEGYCSPQHPSEPLFKEEFVVIVWNGSRLAEVELSVERYLAARHVVMEPVGSKLPAYEGWIMQRYGLSRNIAVSAYSYTTLPYMLVGTEMVGTVHSRVAQQLTRILPLKTLPLPLEIPPLVQTMQWHKHRNHDPAPTWVRTLLKEAAERMESAT